MSFNLALPKSQKSSNFPVQDSALESSPDVDMTTMENTIDLGLYNRIMTANPEEALKAMQRDTNIRNIVISSPDLKQKLFLTQQRPIPFARIEKIDVRKQEFEANAALLLIKDDCVRIFTVNPDSAVSYGISYTHGLFSMTLFHGDEAQDPGDVELLSPYLLDTYLTSTSVYVLASLDTELMFTDYPGCMLIPPNKTLRQILEYVDSWHRNPKFNLKYHGFEVRNSREEFFGVGALQEVPKKGFDEDLWDEAKEEAAKQAELETYKRRVKEKQARQEEELHEALAELKDHRAKKFGTHDVAMEEEKPVPVVEKKKVEVPKPKKENGYMKWLGTMDPSSEKMDES